MSIWRSIIWIIVLFLSGISVGTMSKYWGKCSWSVAVKLAALLPFQTVYGAVLLYEKIMSENEKSQDKGNPAREKKPFLFALRWRWCIVTSIFMTLPGLSSLLAHEQIRLNDNKISSIVRRTKNEVFQSLGKELCIG
ncbi:MAG: hypothetical protein VB078_00845 [Clostridiaceae bacterium]|nr:hypothetical protein [Clostridiaceae bacterium]